MKGIEELTNFKDEISKNDTSTNEKIDAIMAKILEIYDMLSNKKEEVEETETIKEDVMESEVE